MLRRIIFFIAFCLLITSCSDDDELLSNTCSVANPIEDLEWLVNEIQQLEESDDEVLQYFYVSQARYKGSYVFIFNNCCPFCGTVVPVYDCSGELLGILGNREEDIDPDLLSNSVVIWKGAETTCGL